MRRIFLSGTLLILLMCSLFITPTTQALPHSTNIYLSLLVRQTPPPPPTFEEQVISLVNQERAQNAPGCPQFVHNLQLSAAAEGHSQDMADRNYFAHTSPAPSTTPYTRAQQAGYPLWQQVGENIAAGYPTPAEVVAGWMASPEHRSNILNCSFRSTGVGYVYDPNDTLKINGQGPFYHYWTQMFGLQ